jgi:predicted component of type VI protein secretion system
VDAKLVVVGGDAQVRQYDLHLPAVIGRSRSTDVRLGHPLVSRHHCEVFEANGVLMVRDLGSLNGTFVGETRIAEQAMPVKPGELLTVGPVTLRAEYVVVAPNHGKSSTWDTQGPTRDEPMPDGEGQVKDWLDDVTEQPDPPPFRDDDEETARPPE